MSEVSRVYCSCLPFHPNFPAYSSNHLARATSQNVRSRKVHVVALPKQSNIKVSWLEWRAFHECMLCSTCTLARHEYVYTSTSWIHVRNTTDAYICSKMCKSQRKIWGRITHHALSCDRFTGLCHSYHGTFCVHVWTWQWTQNAGRKPLNRFSQPVMRSAWFRIRLASTTTVWNIWQSISGHFHPFLTRPLFGFCRSRSVFVFIYT